MAFSSLKKYLPSELSRQAKNVVVCGIDEVGRGCWAGPLVGCALILKKEFTYKNLKDSKKMSPEKREEVFNLLQKCAVYGVGIVQAEEVDHLGLIKATNLSFTRALDALKKQQQEPDYLLIDGRDKLTLPYPFTSIIKGDEKIKVIACASIVAKVTRDRLMIQLAKKYPHYGFEEHKGYGTERHHQALQTHGILSHHRKSYKPVKALL